MMGTLPHQIHEDRTFYGLEPSPFPVQQPQWTPNKRPLWMWSIGVVDLLAVLWSSGILIHDIYMKRFYGPDMYFWWFFLGSVIAVIKLLMAVGLLTGLRNSDDSTALWYCNMWIYFQCFFLLQSVIYLVIEAMNPNFMERAAFWPKWTNSFILAYCLELITFVYRVITFVFVKRFTGRLEKPESFCKELPIPIS